MSIFYLALYRVAKAYFALNLLPESTLHCQNGLKHDPSNEELKKLLRQIESKKMEHEQREAQVSKAISEVKDLVSAIESRGLKIGKAMYQELTGLRKPVLDKNNILNWPVLLLYAEKAARLCHGIRNTISLVKLLNYTMK
ncbi:tetratricopeptide repeat protein 4 homolog [Prunus yedoensis var. nudiflora]|uniref:Tetratricopeptide repeat protein 4 homolog n=1 Tax=Prunus yedoensis var. nudiflora TaxID=2094558 RepID=A0A314ZRF1_PRUYE|nr:tetratricopeptide repeat protein 4 homolog [Prunus yedoensis var. nudiflora]